MDCFHLELAITAQVAHPTPRRAIKKWVLFLGTLTAVVIGIYPFHKCRIINLITHLEESTMTLQTQHTANAPATLTDEQRRRVADALENAQSVNTRRNYAGQFRKFCE